MRKIVGNTTENNFHPKRFSVTRTVLELQGLETQIGENRDSFSQISRQGNAVREILPEGKFWVILQRASFIRNIFL